MWGDAIRRIERRWIWHEWVLRTSSPHPIIAAVVRPLRFDILIFILLHLFMSPPPSSPLLPSYRLHLLTRLFQAALNQPLRRHLYLYALNLLVPGVLTWPTLMMRYIGVIEIVVIDLRGRGDAQRDIIWSLLRLLLLLRGGCTIVTCEDRF